MKKAIYRTDYMMKSLNEPEEETTIGFCPEYMWRSTAYFNGPKKYGKYLVIGHDGKIKEMYCTGTNSTEEEARELFRMAMDYSDGYYYSNVYLDEEEAKDSDLLSLYRRPWSIWYTMDVWYEYEDRHTDIHIYTKDHDKHPLYFLDLNLDDKIELDETTHEISDSEGVQYYAYDSNYYDVIKQEENKS